MKLYVAGMVLAFALLTAGIIYGCWLETRYPARLDAVMGRRFHLYGVEYCAVRYAGGGIVCESKDHGERHFALAAVENLLAQEK